MAGHLLGGFIDYMPQERPEDFKTRLLTKDGRGRRLALLDNLKSHRFSSEFLEGLITNSTINGHQMFVGDASRPNFLTWCITVNGASLSKDLAQRCVIVQLARPKYSGTWAEETRAYIDAHRWAIIGDCLAALRAPVARLAKHSRWGAWEDAVLARVAEPKECQKLIAERQDAVDEDQNDYHLVREGIVTALRENGHDPDRQRVLIPSRDLARMVEEATAEKRPVAKASAYVKTLEIAELSKSDRADCNGWVWTPAGASATAPAVLFRRPARWS
jgi:hypothetical protein